VPDRKKRLAPLSLLLSACLNLALVTALLYEDFVWAKLDSVIPPEVTVDLVPGPEPAKPTPVEPPKPQPPKAVAPKPAPSAEPPPPPVMPRPLPPQLSQAPLAHRSTAPRRKSAEDSEKHVGAEATSLALGKDAKAPDSAVEEGPELTQSEQDLVLSQIMKYWHLESHSPQARGLILQAVIVVKADGTLASPLNKDDPWDPEAVLHGYAEMVREGHSYRRETIDGFLLALRLCQPLKLPPGGPWPRHMTLRLALDDL
jgi:hypothetical protein